MVDADQFAHPRGLACRRFPESRGARGSGSSSRATSSAQVSAAQFGQWPRPTDAPPAARGSQAGEQRVRAVALTADLERVHRGLSDLLLGGEDRQAGQRRVASA